jgi:hypothetical protein
VKAQSLLRKFPKTSAEPAPETDTSEIQEESAVPVTDSADDASGESLNDIDTSAMDDIDFDFPFMMILLIKQPRLIFLILISLIRMKR